MSKEPKTVRLFVYGTLKRGFPLEGWLKRATFVGEADVLNYTLISLTAFPAMFYTGMDEHGVRGEVYDVPAADFERLEAMEGAVGYETEMVNAEGIGNVCAFVLGEIHQGPVTWKQTGPKTGTVIPADQ